MCSRTTCRSCGKATWSGCGNHVEQALAGVPASERCQCATKQSAPKPAAAGAKSGPTKQGFFARLRG